MTPASLPQAVNQAPPEGAVALDAMGKGAEGTVVAVQASASLRRRLLEMGFVAGTPVRVVRRAPLGDPMEVTLHGYHLSLRRSEARVIYLNG